MTRLFYAFIYTSLFIAACAVLMVLQTAALFRLQVPPGLYLFAFAGTLTSYNFHWYLTPPPGEAAAMGRAAWAARHRRIHLLLFLAGAAVSAWALWLLRAHWFPLLIGAVLAFLYSAPKISFPPFMYLRKVAIGKTIYLAGAWTYVTAVLPLWLGGSDLQGGPALWVIGQFFFLYAICILFDRRDRESDREQGIRSLVTLLPPEGVHRLFLGAWAAAAIATTALFFYLPPLTTWALLLPILIMETVQRKARTDESDFFYYFLLDGLMTASAPIVLLLTFAF